MGHGGEVGGGGQQPETESDEEDNMAELLEMLVSGEELQVGPSSPWLCAISTIVWVAASLKGWDLKWVDCLFAQATFASL